jgi:selenocysteine-specific elongation factor
VITTAGHVDHGKSTLLRALTGMEPDRLAEERRRGLTLDLGYAWTTLAGPDGPRPIAFVDVPGHERFVATMLAGAGPAPTALLVVAADDGWSRQSTEHRDVLDLLGVPGLAVVVTKADLVDAEHLDAVVAEVERERSGTSLRDAPLVVTDALSGRGLTELTTAIGARLRELPAVPDVGRPRLWVDRAFAVAGAGTVVTGTLTGGALDRGAEVRILPDERRARVRGVQSLGNEVVGAAAGTRVALNLGGVDHDEVARGDTVVGAGAWRVTRRVDVRLRVLPGHRVSRTGAWHLHVGSARTGVRPAPIAGVLDGDDPDHRSGVIRLELAEPLALVAGDRVVLRDAGRRLVAAGGEVVDADPPPRPRRARDRRRLAERLASLASTPDERLRGLVAIRGGSAAATRLLAAAGWPPDDAVPEGLVAVGDHLVDTPTLARWREAVPGLGAGTHDREAVAAAAERAGLPPSLARPVTDHLVETGVVVRTSGGVALPEHVDEASLARRRRADAVLARLLAEPFAPPPVDELARQAGMDHRELAALVQAGEIVRTGKVAFARGAVADAATVLRERFGHDTAFTAAQAKEAWGTTRRFAIPLLEHLDRTGVTSFDGQLRTVR